MDMKHKTAQAVMDTRQRRQEERRSFRDAAKSAHDGFARRSGALVFGLDSDGAHVETKCVRAFRIFVDKWYVRLGFKQEDGERLKDMKWADVELTLKNGEMPTRLVRIDTHIISAVRALKHVSEGYAKEIEQTDSMLATLDALNHGLVMKKKAHTDIEIDSAISLLKSVVDDLEKKRIAIKRVVAKGRIEKAVSMLEKAKEMQPGGKRDFQVGAACAVIVSVRNRLSTWRDKEIAGKAEYNLQKECSLRMERDRWLYSQLSRFASDPGNVYTYWVADKDKVEVLSTIFSMMKGKGKKEDILGHMEGKSSMFRVSERQRLKGQERLELMNTGEVRGKKNVDFLMSHYELLYLAIKAGKLPQAKKELRHLELFVSSNKPDFICEELSKNPDPYLAPVITAMNAGVVALTFKHFDSASKCFEDARTALGAVVYPRPQKPGKSDGTGF